MVLMMNNQWPPNTAAVYIAQLISIFTPTLLQFGWNSCSTTFTRGEIHQQYVVSGSCDYPHDRLNIPTMCSEFHLNYSHTSTSVRCVPRSARLCLFPDALLYTLSTDGEKKALIGRLFSFTGAGNYSLVRCLTFSFNWCSLIIALHWTPSPYFLISISLSQIH